MWPSGDVRSILCRLDNSYIVFLLVKTMKEQRSNETELLAVILTGIGIGALIAQESRRSANSVITEAI